jgi:AraC-like DNA-binding protein
MIIPIPPLKTYLSIFQYGYEKCPSTHDSGKNIRHYYLFHVVESGAGTYEINGKEYKINPMSIFLIPPGEYVQYKADQENPYTFFWIGINGSTIIEWLQHTPFKSNYIVEGSSVNNALKVLKKLNSIEKNNYSAELEKTQCLLEFMQCFTYDDDLGKNMLLNQKSSIIERAIAYICDNMQNVTVEDLTKELKISRNQLFRVFKKELSLSPGVYIREYRLDRSLWLIEQTKYTITEIAAMCGFYDSNHYCKLFKNKYKRTPISVRKRPITTNL